MSNSALRSPVRLMQIFDAVAQSPEGITLSEISALLDSPKSSLLNLLRPLVEEGYLQKCASRYLLGPAAFHMASTILGDRQPPSSSRSYLQV
jgi:DNA-binding IclR family transcriptional regulator